MIVPNFSGQEPSAWCEDTLEKSRTKGKGILYVVAYEDGTNVSCAGVELAKDSSTRPMLDGALRIARKDHKTTPLTPEEAVAGSRTHHLSTQRLRLQGTQRCREQQETARGGEKARGAKEGRSQEESRR